MKIQEIRAYAGPNIYSHRPVVRMRLALGAYADTPSTAVEGFSERLLFLLPGLAEHHCSVGHRGGFVERLKQGTYPAHIIEHSALELQCMVGLDASFGKARETSILGVYDIIIGCVTPEVGEVALLSALEIVSCTLENKPLNINTILKKIKQIAHNTQLGPTTAAIVAEAETRGIPVTRIGNDSLVMLGYGSKQRRIQAASTDHTSLIASDIACSKHLTKEMLSLVGVPVPHGGLASSPQEAVQIAQKLAVPVVIKPADGNQGKAVTMGLRETGEIKRAFALAREISGQVIVEEYVEGRQFRLLVVNGQMVAGAERFVPSVVGDGIHTIEQLVAEVNSQPERGEDHEKPLTKIKLDSVAILALAKQNKTLSTVPAAGESVALRDSANLSTGGTAVDVTDEVHPEMKAMAERAARQIGLDIAGIDIVTYDISQPPIQGRTVVIEVNAAPGIRMHHYPVAGKPRNVAANIVDMLYPDGETGRIPLIAITGTNGKTTTTRLISHILSLFGYKVGMTATDGVYINGSKIINGDATGPRSAMAVLQDTTVDAAVLETARGGIIRGGLAFKECDIGIVTNLSDDHIGQDGIKNFEDLAHIKSLIVETVRKDGKVLLNADDKYVSQMANRSKGSVIYFSMQADSILVRRHLGIGGQAVFIRNGRICAAQGGKYIEIIAIDDIPITFGGVAMHNVQNAMVAAGACLAQGIPLAVIRRGLKTFVENPGRLNMLKVKNFRVVVDYGHNSAGYEALIQTMRHFNTSRIIGVICSPGDRPDEAIRNIGRISAGGFEKIIIKEDTDLRGRKPGEVAKLLLEGVQSAESYKGQPIQIILDEAEAIRTALGMAKANDFIVVFYEKYDRVLKVLQECGSTFPRIEQYKVRSGRWKTIKPSMGVAQLPLTGLQ